MNSMISNMPPLAQGRRKKWAFGSLCFSLFYCAPFVMFYSQMKGITVLLGCAVYAIFVFIYLNGIFTRATRVHWPIMGLFLVAGLSVKFNPAGLILFGFGHFMMGYHYRLSSLFWMASLALIFQLGVSLLFAPEYGMYIWPTLFTSLGLLMFGVFEQKEQVHRQAQESSAEELRMMSAIAERERIGRDLHDIAGHSLSSIALKAELASKLLAKGQQQKAQTELNDLAHIARQLLSDIRHAVSDIQHAGLNEELDKAVRLLRNNGMHVHSNFQFDTLNKEQETQLTFIIKELTTNILKHSSANEVELTVIIKDTHITLVVADNGTVTDWQQGNGFKGIEQRIAPYNGKLDCNVENGMKVNINMERAQ